MKRLERAQLQVLFRVPFFAPGVCKLPVSFVSEAQFAARFGVQPPQVCSACTDGKEIWWCQEWFDGLPDDVLPTVLCHEACHCMLGHLWRAPVAADHRLWNIACVAGDVPISLTDGRTSIRASEVRVGSRLYTPFGEASVSRIVHKRANQLARIRFANSRSLVCTPDHPIITAQGRCVEASECRGASVFQAVVGERQTVSAQELGEVFCNADSRHIGSHLQDMLRESQNSWADPFIGHTERYGRVGAFGWAEAMAIRLSGRLDRRGRDHSGKVSQDQIEALLPPRHRSHNNVCFAGSSIGRAWSLFGQMSEQSRSRVHQRMSDELEWVRDAAQGTASVSHYQAAASCFAFASLSDPVKARLVRQPSWLAGIQIRPERPSGFERQAVRGVEEFSGFEDVYDFVTDLGCYVAGGVLVHNCDHAVNLMLKEFSGIVKDRGLADPFPFPFPQDAYCADPQFSGMAEEAIFVVLNNRPKGAGTQPDAQGKAQCSRKGQSGGQGNKMAAGGSGAHSMPDFGQFQASDVGDKRPKTEWEATLLQACQLAKGQGCLPGSMERYLSELVSPEVDWRQVLRSWLREQCADDWDFTRPAMEYSGSQFILPSMQTEKMGPVVFASDWSGSTFGDLVKMFHAEKQSCLDECRPSQLVDLGFDTRVVSQRVYVPGDLIDGTIKGGGGTSFVEVLAAAADMWPKPKCIVLLTDCHGEWPKEDPSVPLIVVTWTKDAKIPFGELIHVPLA